MHEHVLHELAATIAARRADRSGKSYTHQLLESGTERCARKFGEEATETVIAAVSQSEQALAGEAADLLYHLLVLLESRNVKLDDVLAVLASRAGTSGLAEKAARAQKTPR